MLDLTDFYEACGARNDKGNVRYDKQGKPKSFVQPATSEDFFKMYREMYRSGYLRAGYSERHADILADTRMEEFKLDFPVMYNFWCNYLKQR